MRSRLLAAVACVLVLGLAAWLGLARSDGKRPAGGWEEVAPGVWRSPGPARSYALVDGETALLIDATSPPEGLRASGVKKIDAVLLTHHHRDSCAAIGAYLEAKVPVRAPRASAEWLTPENVKKYWQESLPLRNSRTAYLVLPVGVEGVDCTLDDGQAIDWHGWSVQVKATPGHSRDHVAYAARKGKDGPVTLFSGDALTAVGKVWTPYTTDWDHWTDAGLKPAGESLRKLADLKPATVFPAHGDPITKDATAAITKTAENVEEMAFLKSFERFTKKRLGNAPEYKFLAKEQAESNGSKPWTKVSDHLWLTGNTYVLVSKDNAFLVIDPWARRSVDQVAKLKTDEKLGKLEVVWFSHAHYDHYDGIYDLPDRDSFEVWTLDSVAEPIANPMRLRAPFLDARPVKIDRVFKEGESATWREYRFRFHHLPGQSRFTMGVECQIDGKKCWFTADNWFHQDQFSGTGGWMGLNRSFPLPYAESAQKVLDAAPEWVLAEHGGPFEFNAEDFKRRVEWGKVSAKAADAMSPSGSHRLDWDPHTVRIEPLVQKARPGQTIKATLFLNNPLAKSQKLDLILDGRGVFKDETIPMEAGAGKTVSQELSLKLDVKLTPGRHVFAVRSAGEIAFPADAFLAIDVER